MIATSGAGANNMLVLAMMVAGVAILLFVLRKRAPRDSRTGGLRSARLAELRDERLIRSTSDELLIQLEEMARRIGAQVDTKFARLDRVIVEAEEKTARLEEAIRAARALGVASDGAFPAGPAEPPQPRQDRTANGDAASLHPPAQGSDADPRFRSVYDLADSGRTPVQIAETLGMPLGEVELVLNLRRFG